MLGVSEALMIESVFFDFGGVIAEEGWVNGLKDIAEKHGFEPAKFFDDACEVLWTTGYMYGRATEDEFWEKLSAIYDFEMSVEDMRQQIFDRFIIRGEVLALIEKIRLSGKYRLAILSDQTNWLEEFNEMYGFFGYFERVYNSYNLGKGKKDQSVFPEVCADFGVDPEKVLFVDDNASHIERAKNEGLQVYHFADWQNDVQEIEKLLDI
jgi:putative hydrolase of the HAD superfamily